jgi:hypothetical protein
MKLPVDAQRTTEEHREIIFEISSSQKNLHVSPCVLREIKHIKCTDNLIESAST